LTNETLDGKCKFSFPSGRSGGADHGVRELA
jgi:hypothetical protein